MEETHGIGALVGRIMLAVIFVLSGIGKLRGPAMTAGYMTQAGFPHGLVYPGLYLSILVELGCGLLVVVGYKARWAALIIFLWLIPVTLVFHVMPYQQAVQQHQMMIALQQQLNYMKNIAIMGGLLMIASLGAGRLSFDGRGSTVNMASMRRAA
jgi:putative oxidoreductase